jgi:hypothetical protein
VSRDGGMTWECKLLGRYLDYYCFALDPVDPNVVYIGMRGKVVKSTDGGATFTTVLEVPQDPWFMTLAHDPVIEGHVFFAGHIYDSDTKTTAPLLYETRDAGENVVLIETPIEDRIGDLVYDGKRQTLYVAAKGGVYKFIQ